MKKVFFSYFLGLICLLLGYHHSLAQLITPQPSPSSTITQKVGLTDFTIKYSRPSVKGRKIFGDVVPWGKLWRTGANAPTKISFSDEVMIEGNKVPAGEYTLITIPEKDNAWTIILNKDTKGNGVFTYQEADDVLRITTKASILNESVETFTMQLADITNSSANLEIRWEKTLVKVKIGVDYDTKVMEQIKKQLNPARDAGMYAQIATYYLEHNKNLNEALELINKSVELTPRYWTMHTKAKIQQKLKDYKSAIATAEKSIQLAKESKDDNYVRLNEKLIEDCKKESK